MTENPKMKKSIKLSPSEITERNRLVKKLQENGDFERYDKHEGDDGDVWSFWLVLRLPFFCLLCLCVYFSGRNHYFAFRKKILLLLSFIIIHLVSQSRILPGRTSLFSHVRGVFFPWCRVSSQIKGFIVCTINVG